MAPIAVGDVLTDGTLSYFDKEDKLQSVSVHSLAAGKKVILLFGVPGTFNPTCRYQGWAADFPTVANELCQERRKPSCTFTIAKFAVKNGVDIVWSESPDGETVLLEQFALAQ